MSEIFWHAERALSLNRWQRLCRQLGMDVCVAIEQEFRRIAAAYGESHRTYHTAQHINECLDLLDWAVENVSIAPRWRSTLEMALWYHDVVYQPRASDNERRSAGQAIAFLQSNGVASAQIDCVEALIMATCHFADSELDGVTEVANWMVDIDLAILGANPQRFWQYNRQIRQEYAWLPVEVYRAKRKDVLARFLERSVIYRSMLFRERFAPQARENLCAAIVLASS